MLKPTGMASRAATNNGSRSRLFRKSKNTAAILAFQGHVLMEHRSVLVVGAVVTHADGFGERAAALAMLDTLPGATPRHWRATRLMTCALVQPVLSLLSKASQNQYWV